MKIEKIGDAWGNEVPTWLGEYCEFVADHLGLQAWELRLELCANPSRTNSRADAEADVTAGYLFATISFRANAVLKETMSAKIAVCHELLHCTLGHMSAFELSVIDDAVPEAVRPVLHQVRVNVMEETIVRLSREIYRLVEPLWQARAASPVASEGDQE